MSSLTIASLLALAFSGAFALYVHFTTQNKHSNKHN